MAAGAQTTASKVLGDRFGLNIILNTRSPKVLVVGLAREAYYIHINSWVESVFAQHVFLTALAPSTEL